LYKLFNAKIKTHSFNFNTNLNNLNNYTDLSVFESTHESKSFFFNKSNSFKNLTLFSSNQSIPLTNRYVRNFVQNSPSLSHYNYSTNLNTVNDYLFDANSNLGLNNFFFFNSANSDWSNLMSSNRYFSSKISIDYPYSAVLSNNPGINSINYDNLSNTDVEEVPTPLQGKEESMPSYLTGIY
jgi:hypothetical protein